MDRIDGIDGVFARNLASPVWRIENLLKVKEEGTGRAVPFRLRDEQRKVIEFLESPEGATTPLYIIKSRRLGLSTGLAAYMGEAIKWNAGAVGALIERSGVEAGKKMRRMFQFFHDSYPPEVARRFETLRRSNAELAVRILGLAEESTLEAGVSARGSDLSFLWISEGQIIASDKNRGAERWTEIKTGAWEAARKGRKVVETTWKGGKGGGLWDMISPILKGEKTSRGKIMFFPWYGDANCMCFDNGPVSGEVEDYLRSMGDALGGRFSKAQKRFYQVTSAEQGIFMKREYPTTLEEAFSAPVEGAIYAGALATLEAGGKLAEFPVAGDAPVNTSWDLGAPGNTVVWFWQVVGREIRVVDVVVGGPVDMTMVQRVGQLQAKGYVYGTHFLPHDGESRDKAGSTYSLDLKKAGLAGKIEVLERCQTVWDGINDLLELFPSLAFRKTACERGLDGLRAYRVEAGDAEPVHDWASHIADALRTMAEAYSAGRFVFKWAAGEGKRRRKKLVISDS